MPSEGYPGCGFCRRHGVKQENAATEGSPDGFHPILQPRGKLRLRSTLQGDAVFDLANRVYTL